ncbi:hypothetical protein P4U99_23735 [Brevibacillus agri]|uniref:hypothetical protein n=1 Tax=Brevibacillus agri TaxID=51101 RepID=UPI001C8DBE50|nr:hypothetical protein [Brevibacillus agri]MBY0054707.1 hypothetical protein [Brevibacillus agri]MCG5251196.1 hypothetical protein [Brevibacillus agri]MED1646158.1 hypothetical protein [Brevibacillus agri]MED1656144.1 hypothetical protein [Brevibacillus agri]MED1689909.1 hypothetical protein [Brevibacillus agri]
MKKTKQLALAAVLLAASVCSPLASPGTSAASAASTTTNAAAQPSKIYRISLDGKKQTLIAQLPAVHRASMSPSGRFVYAEKQGFKAGEPTIPYLYDSKTKQLRQLSGFAKWAQNKDELLLMDQASLYRYNPLTNQKTLLVKGTADTPILDYALAPDGHYLTFIQSDRKEPNLQKRHKLYLQDMNTLKMKVNDQFSLPAEEESSTQAVKLLYWIPTSKKVLYKANGTIKELDLPTGLKYTHSFKSFPSYSNDMKLRFDVKEWHGFMTDLQTGKSVPTADNPHPVSMDRDLTKVFWSPTGHNYVAEKFLFTSNAQDAIEQLVVKTANQTFTYPLDGSSYLDTIDNIQFLGWAADGKSFFVGDLDSVHMSRFEGWQSRVR